MDDVRSELFTVRLYNRFDGWIDCLAFDPVRYAGVTYAEADAWIDAEIARWGGRREEDTELGYYAIFPEDTVMLQRPETMDPL